MSVATPVAIAGSDGGSAQRASVITALEGKHQVFAGVIAHQLQRILNGLRATHVEVYAAFYAKALFAVLGDARGHFHFLRVQVLAGELWQAVNLPLQGIAQALVFVTKARRGIPHLQIEVGSPFLVVKVTALAIDKDFRGFKIVYRVAKGAILLLEGQ